MRGSSSGPFTTTLVAASNLSVGSGVLVIFSYWAHLTASALFRARAPGPVSGRLSDTTVWRRRPSCPGFPSRFRYRHSLLGHPIPAEELGPPHGRLTGQRPDLDGITAFRTHEQRLGWAPPLPRGRRCSIPTGTPARPAPAASQRHVPEPRSSIPPCGALFDEASTEVHAIHPSSLPLTCGTPGGTGALGLSPELRTSPTGAGQRTPGWGQANRART